MPWSESKCRNTGPPVKLTVRFVSAPPGSSVVFLEGEGRADVAVRDREGVPEEHLGRMESRRPHEAKGSVATRVAEGRA